MNRQLQALYREYEKALLAEWQAAFHGEEMPCHINEFGILNEEKYAGILCICRETNGWSNEDYRNGTLFRPWLADIVESGLQNRGHITKHPNMWYNLGRWVSLIQNPEQDLDKLAQLKTLEPLGAVAFTNINKIRGKNSSGKEYAQLAASPVTREVLRREIEILQPKVLLCGGTAEVVESLLPDNFSGQLLRMPHPGCRKSVKSLLQRLQTRLK